MEKIKRCTRCIMDNSSDKTISFDLNGVCNYCTDAYNRKGQSYFPNEIGKAKLEDMIKYLKETNKKREYDCIMGISGGLDSSYLAYLGHKWGLRILAFHIDDGFDTPISKRNIERLVKKCNIDMRVIKPDRKQFNSLTKAYILAQVPNLAAPQDNVLFAEIFKNIKKTGVKQFLSGGNFALESILQIGNTHPAYDLVNITDIHKKFGEDKINKLEFTSFFQRWCDSKFLKIDTLLPLNYIDYNKEQAFLELSNFCDFEYYGRKHLENTLTAFAQLYWYPQKFGVDKRTSHLSSLIVSGQMTRDEAMKEYNEPICNEEEIEVIIKTVLTAIEMTRSEFDSLMMQPPKQHSDYKTSSFEKNMLLLKKWLRK